MPPTQPPAPPPVQAAASISSLNPNVDPLLGAAPPLRVNPLARMATDPLGAAPDVGGHGRSATQANGVPHSNGAPLDPLGGMNFMTGSLRAQQPNRSRLDARDAARKLANSGF